MENFNQNTAGGQGGNVTEEQGITNTAGAQGKTYTQDEVDNMINAALGKKLSGMPTKEELAEFKNWKKSQKTEEEKKAEREAEFTKMTTELSRLKAEKKVTAANAKSEFSEFVAAKVLGMEGDFDKNLEDFKKSNPQYFGETVIKKVSSSSTMAGSGSERTTNEIMNEILRRRGE